MIANQEAYTSPKIPIPTDETGFESSEDPVNHFGFGIVSYFSLISTMIFLFLVLTIIHIPIIRAYSSYNNYETEIQDRRFKLLSLGNMGFAEPRCIHSGLSADKTILSCKTGQIHDIVDFGFLSYAEDQDVCVRPNATSPCDKLYSHSALRQEIEKACLK